MRATEELRSGHDALRLQLARLEEWLPFASAAPLTLQNLTRSIARLLRDHTEREELLLSQLQHHLGEQPHAHELQLLTDHEHQCKTVTALMALLSRCRTAPVDQLVICATHVISGLREQMAHEESQVFPAVDQFFETHAEEWRRMRVPEPAASQGGHAQPPAEPGRPPIIASDMLVEDVLRVHPRAREIFQTFGINAQTEREGRLYGLEWRRNVDVEALTLALNQSLGVNGGAMPASNLLWNSCDGLMVIDAQRRILAMNPAMERLVGRRVQDVAGQHACGSLLACQDASGCAFASHPERCPGLKAMRRRRAVSVAEYTIAIARGRHRPVVASYTPVRGSTNGGVWALVRVRHNLLQKRRERHLAQQALRDPLTGLFNRAGILEACANELSRASRHAHPVAIAMADLDGLKAYNDTYGHLAGDEVLKTIAGLLQSGRRATEVVSRYGGDEFALLLPETTAAGATAVIDRVRQAVAQIPFPQGNGGAGSHAPVAVTLSVGIAVFPEDGTTLGTLLEKVDARLYEAKHRGRNQVVGPADCLERRRHRRVSLDVPIILKTPDAAGAPSTQEGRIINVSLAGGYCTVAPWSSLLRIGELLSFSITIPATHRTEFPYAELAGHGRIVRVQGLPETARGEKRMGIGFAFEDDVTGLPKDAGNGRAGAQRG